mgnify:FL=1
MSWRKLRGVDLPYEKQVYIRAVCLLWREQPKKVQTKIRRLCENCGGVYSAALWDAMTTKQTATQIALRHHIDESTLYRIRAAFYERW